MRKFGWVRPLVKFPANFWRPEGGLPKSLPSEYTLDVEHLAAFDQGESALGSIAAVLGCVDIGLNTQKSNESYTPSLGFTHRGMYTGEGITSGNPEVSITDVIKHIQAQGYVSEQQSPTVWDTFSAPLSDDEEAEGADHLASQFANISLSTHVFKAALIQGHPIVCGVVLFPDFVGHDTETTGLIRYDPAFSWPIGGTGLVLTGWSDSRQSFRTRLSLGSLWGDNGYGWIPYQYIMSQSCADDHYVFLSP